MLSLFLPYAGRYWEQHLSPFLGHRRRYWQPTRSTPYSATENDFTLRVPEILTAPFPEILAALS
jgi:hypothetical protein